MIFKYLKDFNYAQREIAVLRYAFVILFFFVVFRACSLTYEEKYTELWGLLTPAITCLSVLVGCSVANRLIANGNIVRADEQRIELMRTTHYLIAVTKDLRQKINYVKSILSNGKSPAIALVEISKTIQKRYEIFYEPNIYKHLPGNCIDIITSISAKIYGIGVMSAGIEMGRSENILAQLKISAYNESHPTIQSLIELDSDLKKLINEIFIIRESVDDAPK